MNLGSAYWQGPVYSKIESSSGKCTVTEATNTQHDFLKRIEEVTRRDPRLTGLLIGGSYASGKADNYSDLDCILIADQNSYATVLADRKSIAESVAPLLHCFGGEFFGEPRLLVCLYREPLMHVDYKIMTVDMLQHRVEDPLIVWERDPAVRSVLQNSKSEWPEQSSEWFEDRFWIWVHYAATKIARGELFEALDMFALLRKRIFGPLLSEKAGKPQYEVRHIERLGPDVVKILTDLNPPHDRNKCLGALEIAIDHYLNLSRGAVLSNRMPTTEQDLKEFLAGIRQ
jgi:predicted nucleotidyltransferase